MTRNLDPRYRFNPFYRNHFKEGQFVSDKHAKLPEPEQYVEEEPSELDIELQLAKDYEAIDRMNAELDAMYVQSMMPPINSIAIPYNQCHLIK